ncbi:hypothetical protein E0H26_05415 [Micromonospora zingiberis]|uniref:Uncharacterized protein n=1 Tax=Micromonospora zingiberis TaxID=2053011 RepID=A0A4R0GQ40_9ACTN|nr:hypothetical protein [Micromonospora zingiberis]TCB98862.1 hypothetical protein E0H26_05415 [Micromonospora zingiberis]
MASTGAGVPTAPGRVGGWLSSDRIGTAALAMIALSVLWRAQVASRGFLAADDYVLITQAAESELTVEHLFTLYNNHLMPGGRLLIWLVTEYVGLAYWPYVLLMAIGQAILGITFFRLLRRLLTPSALLLLPLGLLLFSPLTLEATSWWAVGVNMLPMQIAMVLAVAAQVGYVQTRRKRHLVTLALSVLLGVFFFEKAILIVPLVFLLTAACYADGGPVRTIWTTIRRWWPSWLVLTVLSLGFLAAYLSGSESSLRRPESAGEVFSFLTQMFGSTVVPGLVGGPWQWLGAGDGAPVAAPPQLGTWVGWLIVAVVVAATVRRRRRAGRAWLLLAAYLVMVAGMLAATRLGSAFSGVAGGVPRYVSDVVVVAAICLGVAVAGLARATGATEPPTIEPPTTEPSTTDGAPAIGGRPGTLDGAESAPPVESSTAHTEPAVPGTPREPVGEASPSPVPAQPVAAPVPAVRPALVTSRRGVIHAEAPVDPEPDPSPEPDPHQDARPLPEPDPHQAARPLPEPDPHQAAGPVPGPVAAPATAATPPDAGQALSKPGQSQSGPGQPEFGSGQPQPGADRPESDRTAGGAASGPDEPPTSGLLGPIPERYREAVNVVLVLVLVAVCLGTVWTTSRYGDEWAAKSGRSYIETVRIEIASAPPDTVFFDAPVPDNVVPRLSSPYNLQSRFFRAFGTRPTFVDETDNASVLDGLGRVQVATIVGSTIQPGPQEGCGYLVSTGQTVRMPLNEPRFQWHWVVRIGYLSSADGTARLRLGDGVAEFPVRKGLNQRFFRIVGGGDTVELTVTSGEVSLCTNEIAIGEPAPKPE